MKELAVCNENVVGPLIAGVFVNNGLCPSSGAVSNIRIQVVNLPWIQWFSIVNDVGACYVRYGPMRLSLNRHVPEGKVRALSRYVISDAKT